CGARPRPRKRRIGVAVTAADPRSEIGARARHQRARAEQECADRADLAGPVCFLAAYGLPSVDTLTRLSLAKIRAVGDDVSGEGAVVLGQFAVGICACKH